jgi:ABC-type multidrug transport system fused ATPase/permease subunit
MKSKYKRLWKYFRPYWRRELIAFLVMALLAVVALALPGAIRYLIDDLIPSLTASPDSANNLHKVIYFGLFLLGIYLVQVLLTWLRDYLSGYIGANIIADLRAMLFDHLQNLPLKFFQTHQVGEMMSRLLSDIAQIQSLFSFTLLVFLTNVFMLLAVFIYLVNINPIMTFVAIIPVPITILLSRLYGKKMNEIARKLQQTIAALSSRFQENFLSIKTVKAFGREKSEHKRVTEILRGMTKLYIRHSVTSSLSSNLVHFVNMIGPIVVLSWGTYLIAGGSMKLGALIAFYMLLSYLYSPIQDLSSVNIQVQTAMASVDRVFEYLDLQPAVQEADDPLTIERMAGKIEFRDVFFQYEENGFRIENLNLTIRPKEKLAIVGPSGSGKTTIVNLIMRFYDPDAGAVRIDDVDLRKLTIRSLRGNISLVDQDPLLFRGPILNNIRYAVSEATTEQVTEAARAANIHDFISGLPNGYESEVGERGVTLSGGEKQRLCLARAIIGNPSILILDEATSALDSKSEQLIQEALEKILTDKTAIFIAHRLSTVQHADRIIVLDKGRIVDQGRHEELLKSSSLYKELAKNQLKI